MGLKWLNNTHTIIIIITTIIDKIEKGLVLMFYQLKQYNNQIANIELFTCLHNSLQNHITKNITFHSN